MKNHVALKLTFFVDKSKVSFTKMSIEKLRLKITINLFKRYLLKDLHVANKPQSNSLFAIFDHLNTGTILTERTWQSRFSSTQVIPKILKMKELTKIYRALNYEIDGLFSNDNFEQLALSSFAKNYSSLPTSNIRSPKILSGFESISSLGLFLDAVQLSAISYNTSESNFINLIEQCGHAILQEIYLRWAPRHGSIYTKFPSSLKVAWDSADLIERENLERRFERFKPNLFNYQYNLPNQPKASLFRQFSDISAQHIYKYLFSLSNDPDFLTGYKLKVWIFDLATAAFAMHAVAWADRYKTFGYALSQEMIYWGAFQELFINPTQIEDEYEFLELALIDCSGRFNLTQIELLKSAKLLYQNELEELGSSIHEVASLVMQLRKNYPMKYKIN